MLIFSNYVVSSKSGFTMSTTLFQPFFSNVNVKSMLRKSILARRKILGISTCMPSATVLIDYQLPKFVKGDGITTFSTRKQ